MVGVHCSCTEFFKRSLPEKGVLHWQRVRRAGVQPVLQINVFQPRNKLIFTLFTVLYWFFGIFRYSSVFFGIFRYSSPFMYSKTWGCSICLTFEGTQFLFQWFFNLTLLSELSVSFISPSPNSLKYHADVWETKPLSRLFTVWRNLGEGTPFFLKEGLPVAKGKKSCLFLSPDLNLAFTIRISFTYILIRIHRI